MIRTTTAFYQKNHPVLFRALSILFFISVTIGVICTVLGFLGGVDWRFDLLSHFRLQYSIFFFLLVLSSVFLRSKNALIITALCFLLNVFPILAFYVAGESPPEPQSSLLLFSANVSKENTEHDKLLSAIRETEPDVVLLLEVDTVWVEAISPLMSVYPHQIGEIREDFSGILLLSKQPLRNSEVAYLGRGGHPSVSSYIMIDDSVFRLIGTHPVPPFSRRMTELRNDQLNAISDFVTMSPVPTVVFGDLNASPFSYPYQSLITSAVLTNCARGFGYQTTWQYKPLLPPFGLSIDHCLHTAGIQVTESYVGGDIGSDHKPIINRVSVIETN